jgi:hypothetical protein
MNPFILSQILIGFASISDFFSFQIKRREYTLLLFAISSLFIAAHYFLLGAFVGGFVTLVNVSRHLTAIVSRRKLFMYIFMSLVLGLGVYSFKYYFDVLPIAGSLLSTYAGFRATPKALRMFMMVATSLFIIYNIYVGSPGGVILESMFLVSNVISYFRFYKI